MGYHPKRSKAAPVALYGGAKVLFAHKRGVAMRLLGYLNGARGAYTFHVRQSIDENAYTRALNGNLAHLFVDLKRRMIAPIRTRKIWQVLK